MPNNNVNLNKFANVVIVRCRITGVPGINKQDKVRTAELANQNNTTKRHGRVTKTLFADSRRAIALKKIGASVRNWIRVASLPGEVDGKYLIAADMFQSFADKLNKWQEEYRKILVDFVANLDEEIAFDMRAKQNLYDAEDYPTADEVEAAARFDWGFEPLPDASKFADIFDGDSLVAEMQEQHENHIAELFANATEVNLERMTGRISASRGQLKRYTGDKGQRLHCSGIVEGMRETAKTALGLNVSNSEEVSDLATAMQSWSDEYTPCDILKDARTRGKAIKELENMLDDGTETSVGPTGWTPEPAQEPETAPESDQEPGDWEQPFDASTRAEVPETVPADVDVDNLDF